MDVTFSHRQYKKFSSWNLIHFIFLCKTFVFICSKVSYSQQEGETQISSPLVLPWFTPHMELWQAEAWSLELHPGILPGSHLTLFDCFSRPVCMELGQKWATGSWNGSPNRVDVIGSSLTHYTTVLASIFF